MDNDHIDESGTTNPNIQYETGAEVTIRTNVEGSITLMFQASQSF